MVGPGVRRFFFLGTRITRGGAVVVDAALMVLTGMFPKATREEVTVLESGLQYEVVTKGEGETPKATDKVTTHYHGTLINGNVFDSSVDRGEPAQFMVNRVIKGWTEGITYFNEGGEGILLVPSNLGYGSKDYNGIPGGSVLIFDIKLLKVN